MVVVVVVVVCFFARRLPSVGAVFVCFVCVVLCCLFCSVVCFVHSCVVFRFRLVLLVCSFVRPMILICCLYVRVLVSLFFFRLFLCLSVSLSVGLSVRFACFVLFCSSSVAVFTERSDRERLRRSDRLRAPLRDHRR